MATLLLELDFVTIWILKDCRHWWIANTYDLTDLRVPNGGHRPAYAGHSKTDTQSRRTSPTPKRVQLQNETTQRA
jgi:hypothetical protein